MDTSNSDGQTVGTFTTDDTESSEFSAPVGIRTPNLLIRSQMLYPLSYWRFGTKSTHE